MVRGSARRLLFLLAFVPSGLVPNARSGEARPAGLPLVFEANVGQAAGPVRFLARGPGYALLLAEEGPTLRLAHDGGAHEVKTLLRGGRRGRLEASAPLPGRSHYLLGNEPARWRTVVPHFGRVAYRDVYPGIDLVFRGREGRVEYDFVVAPGGSPSAIRLGFEGVRELGLSPTGDLVAETPAGRLVQHAPVAYQDVDGEPIVREARFEIVGGREVRFVVGGYDGARPLVIDPVLSWSTFLGGKGDDSARALAVDGQGNVYVAGKTKSSAFPLVAPRQPASGGNADAFVTKLDPSGTVVLFSTYLGGTADDEVTALAVDAAGHVYVGGTTQSRNFPLSSAYQGTLRGTADVFVARLDPGGATLEFATYLGGNGYDSLGGLAVDASGHVYLAGAAFSTDFPTKDPIQDTNQGNYDGFVTKMAPLGTALVYSTYLGGSLQDLVWGMALDGQGAVSVAGSTWCPGTWGGTVFPTRNAFDTTCLGSEEGFVARIDPSGSSLVYSTLLGGNASDVVWGVAADAAGNTYVTGQTESTDFPTLGGVQASLRGSRDAFVTRLSAGGAPVYSTFLGGSDYDSAHAIAVEPRGSVVVTGQAGSADFPLVQPVQYLKRGMADAFVTRLSPGGDALEFSSLLGGSDGAYGDKGLALALDRTGGLVIAGETQSRDFPVRAAVQGTLGGGFDAFVVRVPLPLFSSGPLSNGFGYVTSGWPAGLSVVQNKSLGLSTAGFGHQLALGNHVADNFTVPEGGWTIETLTFFGYHTEVCSQTPDHCMGAEPAVGFTWLGFRIWDGPPGIGSVVYGDTQTDRLIRSIYSGVHRVYESGDSGTRRAIMANEARGGFSLPAGTYWVDWQAHGTGGSGPWQPPVTVTGWSTTGDGEQSVGGGPFAPALDAARGTRQGFPFEIVGVPTPSLSVDDVAVVRPADGTALAAFTLRLSSGSLRPVTVRFATADGTAEAGLDYLPTSGSLTLPAGSTSATIGVLVRGGRAFRGDRTLHLDLSSPSHATLADPRGTAAISDPGLAGFSVEDVWVTRGPAPATARFLVTLSPTSPSTVAVDFATADGSALAGADYTASSGTLTFPPGTGSLPVDVAVSPAGSSATGVRTFSLVLSGSSGAAVAHSEGVATILDPGFHTLTPCRLADTRGDVTPWGGPALDAGRIRTFPVAGRCGVPFSARAVALNVTVTASAAQGHFVLFPAGAAVPPTSTLNYVSGQTRANNAVVALGAHGELALRCVQAQGTTSHAVVDVTGYFE